MGWKTWPWRIKVGLIGGSLEAFAATAFLFFTTLSSPDNPSWLPYFLIWPYLAVIDFLSLAFLMESNIVAAGLIAFIVEFASGFVTGFIMGASFDIISARKKKLRALRQSRASEKSPQKRS